MSKAQADNSFNPRKAEPLRAVVLGGYGLIGSACLRALLDAGFEVTGIGRNAQAAARIDARATWIIRDLARMSAQDFARDLADVDVIINAAGALQDGAKDNLCAIHETLVENLLAGISGHNPRIIQISAAGVSQTASTAFFTTKARGDATLMASAHDWIVLRPTLVLARAAYGGTALLRAAAAMPLIGASVLADRPVQTVSIDDLAAAVVQSAQGNIPTRTCADLTAADTHTMGDLSKQMRNWLGFAPWHATLRVPQVVLAVGGATADALGWLGWRSPLRSTALTVLKDGIQGDPSTWTAAGGVPCRSTAATLQSMPATTQDRWHAPLFLLLPVAIALLSVFWILSGVIGVFHLTEARTVLTSRSFGAGIASLAVLGGALADIALGVAILWRPMARWAALGMIALSLVYLGMGTIFTPALWADPLGPFVKVIPGISLAAMVAALLEDR